MSEALKNEAFKNKVAVITGAAVGIGRAAAICFAAKGADVALMDMNAEALANVKAEVTALGAKAEAYVCDVSDEAQVKDVFAQIYGFFGNVDILVNNAALWRLFTPFNETSSEEWKKYTEINVFGTVYCTQAVLDKMYANSYGRIINIASVAGVYGNRNMALYSATKGAVIAMTKALAKEAAEHNVTVNAVSPGTVSPSENADIDYSVRHESNQSYMGRTGTGRENAELICYLASDYAAYISGQNIQIDGCRKII